MDPETTELATQPAGDAPVGARITEAVTGYVHGNPAAVEQAVVTLLAGGHLLVQDVPGVGKTSLALAIARAIGARWSRIQFTPDLLPSDVTGSMVFDQSTVSFAFHPGPVFASVVLADEINRSSPRTQSSLLEAMQEGAVTVDGRTHALPRPFLVIATQNPVEMSGTYPLPEAQLDRFMMRISLGYPDREAEARILQAQADGASPEQVECVVTPEQFDAILARVQAVAVVPEVLAYIVAIAEATRLSAEVRLGVSPRGSVALMRAARARAYMQGRAYVVPGDVQELAVAVLAHRLILEPGASARGATAEAVIDRTLEQTPAPQP
ncbi:MAG: MoxR family ATPase [Actinomycetales bacterium]|nr:MoxR family ATPase [Actinomycetales bacterium]